MPKFSATWQRTLSSAGNAKTLGAVGAAAAAASGIQVRRGKVSQIVFGSEATPADVGILLQLNRITAFGTMTAVVPNPLDPADPVFMGQCGQNHSADPTLGVTGLLSMSLNQRTTLIWTAKPGYEFVWPLTANAGLALQTPTINTGTPLGSATILFEE